MSVVLCRVQWCDVRACVHVSVHDARTHHADVMGETLFMNHTRTQIYIVIYIYSIHNGSRMIRAVPLGRKMPWSGTSTHTHTYTPPPAQQTRARQRVVVVATAGHRTPHTYTLAFALAHIHYLTNTHRTRTMWPLLWAGRVLWWFQMGGKEWRSFTQS